MGGNLTLAIEKKLNYFSVGNGNKLRAHSAALRKERFNSISYVTTVEIG